MSLFVESKLLAHSESTLHKAKNQLDRYGNTQGGESVPLLELLLAIELGPGLEIELVHGWDPSGSL